MKSKVFITRRLPEAVMNKLEEIYEIHCNDLPRNLYPDEIREGIKHCDLIITMLADTIDRELINLNPNLKGICNYAVGYNNIDIEAATRARIPVCNTPDVLTETTADLAWALIFCVARRIVEADRYTRSGKFTGWAPCLMLGHDIYGKTLGIVGAGRIGKAVARRALGFGMRLKYYNRSKDEYMEQKLSAEFCTLADLLKDSDFISLHVPYNEDTHHLIDDPQLAQMKKNAILINTSRGKVINEMALIKALQQNQIAAAGLDVYYNEPQVPMELRVLDNAVILPHVGSGTLETRIRMAELVMECARACLDGQMPPVLVNPEVLSEN